MFAASVLLLATATLATPDAYPSRVRAGVNAMFLGPHALVGGAAAVEINPLFEVMAVAAYDQSSVIKSVRLTAFYTNVAQTMKFVSYSARVRLWLSRSYRSVILDAGVGVTTSRFAHRHGDGRVEVAYERNTDAPFGIVGLGYGVRTAEGVRLTVTGGLVPSSGLAPARYTGTASEADRKKYVSALDEATDGAAFSPIYLLELSLGVLF